MNHQLRQAAAVSPDAPIDVAAVEVAPRPRRSRAPIRAARDGLSGGGGASGDDAPADKPKRLRGPIRSTPHSLSEADAALYLGVSRAYLRQGRLKTDGKGTGPAFCRFGRAIRYRLTDLDAWIAAHRIDPSARKRRA